MTAWIIWIILIIGAYLLGSVPASYLAGRLGGVDLRQHGTSQVGGGNLWRMTSWKYGLPVGIFDFGKGMLMVWVAHTLGLSIIQQMVVGLSAIAGHNWPVFLRFHGGRGVGTTMGILTILPLINEMTLWPSVAFWAILIIGRLGLGSSPLPVLTGLVAAPLISWGFGEPLSVTLGFLAILLVIILKRLSAQPSSGASPISKSQLLLNRLLFDRDIRDRKVWMYRKPPAEKEKREG
jgi:glycerol-3-phosphate acyltransferase PlsY